MNSTVEIDWDVLAGDAVEHRATLERVAACWDGRAKQEHLAVGAFALLAFEVAEIGTERVILDLLTRAANDEVRHSDICLRVAAALSGRPVEPVRWAGVPRLRMHSEQTTEQRATLHVVEMCCLSETFTGVFFAEMFARTSHPEASRIVSSLLEDEVDHGKVGWAFLADRARVSSTEWLALELPALLDRVMDSALAPAKSRPEADDPTRERFGYLGTTTVAALYTKTIADVILPGFDHVGVDSRHAREHARRRGWI